MAAIGGSTFQVAVIGGGPTGTAAALAVAEAGFDTVLFAPPARQPPGRTAALFDGSIALLEALELWPLVETEAAALCAIRIVDATRRLLRSPEVVFHASEVGLSAFGYNIPNAALVQGLARRAQALPHLTVRTEPVRLIETGDDHVRIAPETGQPLSVRLVIGADGAKSLARRAAGIGVRSWSYRQSALVTTFAVEREHVDTSTEFHTENGPFTLVPLPGRRMSLVWVDRPHNLEAALSWQAERFDAEVEKRAHALAGAMCADSPRNLFPLQGSIADSFAGRRVMLVGEAAHAFPPIGAQGLNLGFRDVAALTPVLKSFREDPGQPGAIAAFHGARQGDVRSRTLAIDMLNRSLLTGFLPVQAARSFGLGLADMVPLFRRMLIRQGLAQRIGLWD
ncbi:MAG TPA: UbiH/UbiF family hydroxylase [Afifellaceae bacterium]|nr:UbiH/UbiF family hydroxylase [Afifellaceae bacterium]